MSGASCRTRLEQTLREKGWAPLPEAEVALVGSNPLPVYLALKALGPKHAYLLPTEDTCSVADRITEVLKTNVSAIQEVTVLPAIAPVPRNDEIRNRFDQVKEPGGFGLHYTGGTKHMAVHVYHAWLQQMDKGNGSHLHWASYLQVGSLSLVLDREGVSIPLFSGVQLSLDELAALHGVTAKSEREPLPEFWAEARWRVEMRARGGNGSNSPLLPDRNEMIGRDVALPASEGDERLTRPFAGPAWEPFKQALDLGTDGTYGDYLRRFTEVTNRGTPGFFALNSNKRKRVWNEAFKWLEGEWLEEWAALMLARVLENRGFPVSPGTIKPGWTLKAPSDEDASFEVDVVATAGPAAFLLSCTTSEDTKLIKSKLLEAQVRSRQLAGDYAQYAVLTLASKDKCEKVWKQVAPHWLAPNPPVVFHRDQVLDEKELEAAFANWLDRVIYGQGRG
jgi:hypothetical protein